jgi:hypothetical protein
MTRIVGFSDDEGFLQEVAEEVGIRAMPTFMAFKDGAQIDSLQGAFPAKLEVRVYCLSGIGIDSDWL